ncbi:MAG TPA: DegT/DnrJ/EryC1/StrS family aminotransferase [Vicinamibacterales bacterium]|nr:DegT/DnrJ/EryC1/StrS family aminotransferase [Vicinamibacterales bacterium]
MQLTFPLFDDAELANVRDCLQSRWVTMGPWTKRFEEIVAARQGVKHALATTSCTSALHLATLALGLGPGDEVLVPAFTWITSANCAEYVGATPVFVDVSLDTFNLDPNALAAAVTPRTRAIVAVHLFGLAAPMDEVCAVARKHRLATIEDAACAIGSSYKGRPVGGIGEIGCFSFHPRKIVSTGEGGMVTTNDAALAERVASLRNHGSMGHPGPGAGPTKPYHMGRFDHLGYNLRLSDIQSAVGVAQMDKLDGLLAERRRLAQGYDRLLANAADIARPIEPPGFVHTYQAYVIRVTDGGVNRRNRIMERLAADRIPTRPGTHAAHRLGYYRDKYGIRPEQFPRACAAEDTTITLPIFPGMTGADQQTVVDCLTAALKAD